MLRLVLLGPLLLLAGFTPPAAQPLSPKGVQQTPPKSWIPEEAQKPPVTVTPDFPDLQQPPAAPADATCASPSGASTRAFVDTYTAARQAFQERDYASSLHLGRNAELMATSRAEFSATLMMQMLSALQLRDFHALSAAIERRLAIGCLREKELKDIEIMRQQLLRQ